jgi:hypothetical protein
MVLMILVAALTTLLVLGVLAVPAAALRLELPHDRGASRPEEPSEAWRSRRSSRCPARGPR